MASMKLVWPASRQGSRGNRPSGCKQRAADCPHARSDIFVRAGHGWIFLAPDALSMLVHRTEGRGREELIPPHMFRIPIEAVIGGKVIAHENRPRAAPQGRLR